jgi:hypothetical protein
MNTKPISQFFMRLHSFKAIDVAVLFGLMACQETADEIGYPISPAVVKRMWCLDATEEELSDSIKRLSELGEIEWVQMINPEGDPLEGYRVVRMDSFRDDLIDYGRREYNRRAQARHRETRKQLAEA